MELTNKQDYLNKLIDEIQDYAIVLLDTAGNIQNWNTGAKRIKGYCSEEIIGKNFRLFYTKSDQESGLPTRLIETAYKHNVANDEGWRVKKNGDKFWGSVSINAIHDDSGNVIAFGKVTRDLTQRKQAEDAKLKYLKEIEHKNEELEQFTYIASHDLQEPLRSLISFTSLLKEEYSGKIDDTFDIYNNFITSASKRMETLVKGLLDYSRLGKEKLLVTLNCNEILDNVITDLNVTIIASRAEITIDEMLFQNLISNAIKFAKKDQPPKIHISAVQEGNAWLFSVKDNGIGIDEKHKDKIFIIFKRLHNRADYEGTGIGLSHCKKIVNLHGGKIWVESQLNEGSTFKFLLPIL
ncbi:MAG: PAS domain S-box protein [Flavobacteriaceae bacterium]|nr:PAS domain S-box protein [Flavobacteriaceae bacterium]